MAVDLGVVPTVVGDHHDLGAGRDGGTMTGAVNVAQGRLRTGRVALVAAIFGGAFARKCLEVANTR